MSEAQWRNVSSHPVDLDDGRMVPPDGLVPADVDRKGRLFKDAAESGFLVPPAKAGTKAELAPYEDEKGSK